MIVEIQRLLERWHAEVEILRTRYGDEIRAAILEVAAADLRDALTSARKRALTLEEASLWSGYSRSHLRALQRNGTLSQAGRKGRPGFLQHELPIKVGYEPVPPENVRAAHRKRRQIRR